MFIDSVKITVQSGKGGAGCVGFRREKFVQLGGPDGGDGGDGGDVYFLADNNTHTLAKYKGKKIFKAQNGKGGGGRKMTGKSGEDLVLIVPPGTSVQDSQTGEVLLDLTNPGEKKLFFKGGKGGLGNVHFKNSVNQRPEHAQPGLPGQSMEVRLELKLIADVGLVGFPNVGKSTLISTISNARPEIANYEFTTLTPKLGMVEVDEFSSYVMADIPGIIEGASDGRGLGIEFLKHIQRTKVSLFMLDCTNVRTLKAQYNALRAEIDRFSPELANNKFAIAITKADACEDCDVILAEFLDEFGFEVEQNIDNVNWQKPYFVMPISSAANLNIKELKFALLKVVSS